MSIKKMIQSVCISVSICLAGTPGYAQVVASLDAGIAPGTPNIIPGGFDVFNNDADPEDQTISQHGTVVARVMSDVFSGVQILPIKIVGPGFVGDASITNRGLESVTGRDDVRVVAKTTGFIGSFTAWQNVVNAGKVAIMRAGNESQSNPNRDGAFAIGLGGRAIVVGASDSNGNIAAFSNRAGGSAEVYIVAPGFNQFSSIQGTSFAAPRVAAVAAQILAQNPNLAAEQVVEIILNSADDKGDPGTDPVYGRGLLNVEAALAPVDTGGGSSSGGGAIAAAAVVVGGALAWGILRNRDDDSLENTFITDVYDRGYVFDLTKRITASTRAPTLLSLLSDTDVKTDTFVVNQGVDTNSYASISSGFTDVDQLIQRLDPSDALDDYNDELAKLNFYQQSTDGTQYRFSLNDSVRTELGAFALSQSHTNLTPEFEYTGTFTNPYMSFTDQGIASYASYQLDDNFNFAFALSSNEEPDRYGLESDSAIIEGTYTKNKAAVGLQLGSTRELGSLFGGASGGVLSVDESNTVSLGLSGSYQLNDKFSVIGNYTEGYTKVDEWDQSYLQNFSSIRSNSYGLGLVGQGIFRKEDRLGLGYSRPLKVKRGSADLSVPQGREDFGQPLFFNDERINLNPTASEQALEAYYSFQPKKNMQLTTYFLYRNNPDHNIDAGSESTVLATLKFTF